ncbi:hypothetical protein PDIDSM_4007 [Penicillium digitatum]|nr:hypothetical protein PDIDSM_4007 [Penicillium digitatum]
MESPIQKPSPTHASKPSFATSVNTYLSDSTLDWSKSSEKADVEAQNRPRRSFSSIRYLILTIYRRLFSLVYCANAVAFVIVMIRSQQKLLAFINAAGINLLVCGLARHPLVVNAIFRGICCISPSAPLWLRKRAAEAYQYGGVHSGCGLAAFLWYAGLVALISKEYWLNEDSRTVTVSVIVLSYALLVDLVAIIAVAYPTFRAKLHNYFELIHRFGSWLAVALFLALLLVFSDQARHSQRLSLGQYLLRLPAFWFILVIVVSIVHPWLLLRRVQVLPEHLSSHAIRLQFDHTSTAFGKVLALSNHPLKDWHSFATFPHPDGRSFSCIVSKAGDWTTQCIDQKPTHLWKRGVLMYGFIHVMRVFRRVVVVATGSGIGPCLSFLSEKNRPQLRVIWQTRNPSRTYGPDVLGLVHQLDPNPLIVDTSTSGRMDMVPIIQELVREIDAEAVCVISNARLTKQVVFELKASGVIAFGPIFDS